MEQTLITGGTTGTEKAVSQLLLKNGDRSRHCREKPIKPGRSKD